uniref:Reverse transcriptase domain-containing protein n=1 Tax=Tanacetum cinerariifolium TaxID=118510 RepID=A0A6L2NLH7_TANCI|nr:reverse transcriptase domain-containing protein [Tanacetum cinerariifolium]
MDNRGRKAFQNMKKCIAELPIVTTPNPKEELLMYLCAAREAVRAILLTEKDSRQVPVYFVSRALENPRNQLQLNGKTGFIVVDFITEKLDKEGPSMEVQAEEAILEPWTLFTDRSSCLEGSGARLILTRPEGEELTYAVRFEFDASNNEAEYKALVAGLWIAEQISVKNLIAKVPRSENKKEDALSKITSTSFAHLTKKVLVETLKRNSIEEREILVVVEEEGHCWLTPLIEYLVKGPFPEAQGKVKFLILGIDYFTKWIEAKPVATITGSEVKKFVCKIFLCRFGLPGEIISDNGKQFRDNPFKDWCEKLNIKQRFASVKHPQTNGQVERANHSLREGIKARLGKDNRNWVEKVPHVLWAHRTMIKISNGDTLFSRTYERREKAAIREARNKGKMEKYYNAKVRSTSFRPGDFVYRNNEASHAKEGRKLGPKWEGPYKVVEALGKGAYKLKNSSRDILPHTWNVQDLKKCYL